MASTLFQGVACLNLDANKSFQDAIVQILNIQHKSSHENIDCFDLKLDNKYYETTINLFDCDTLKDDADRSKVFDRCQAVILSVDGESICIDTLDERVKQLEDVSGEPRILLLHGIAEGCPSYRSIQSWSIANGFDLISAQDDDVEQQLVDSLSAYKWKHRVDKTSASSTTGVELDEDVLKQLRNFDDLLSKISAFRDRPEGRNETRDDQNIKEIAEILSNLLSEDGESCLDEEDDESVYSEDDQEKFEGGSVNRDGYERIEDTNHTNGNDGAE